MPDADRAGSGCNWSLKTWRLFGLKTRRAAALAPARAMYFSGKNAKPGEFEMTTLEKIFFASMLVAVWASMATLAVVVYKVATHV